MSSTIRFSLLLRKPDRQIDHPQGGASLDTTNEVKPPASRMDAVLARVNIDQAWEDIYRNKGGPGIDGVTLARWARNWEANIERLREQARTNTYHPNRPKRFTVRKKGGGKRELSRLTISDKVLQRAVLNVIDDIFEPQFLDCSHGYRPKRSVATAVQQVLECRDRGLKWVLDADIHACFDHLDHGVLLGLLGTEITDWFTINLMERWLKAGRKYRSQPMGVPMGAVLSPLWCNIYLHQLDLYLTRRGWQMIRYADDFLVMASSLDAVKQALKATRSALVNLELQLSQRKTRLVSFDKGFVFLGVEFIKDRYSYMWEQKRIEVKGRDTRQIYRHLPRFYQ
jgi:group II intron reverse transcriptase/maturase